MFGVFARDVWILDEWSVNKLFFYKNLNLLFKSDFYCSEDFDIELFKIKSFYFLYGKGIYCVLLIPSPGAPSFVFKT